MSNDNSVPAGGEIPAEVLSRIEVQARQAIQPLYDLQEREKIIARKGYEMGARAEFRHWNSSYPKQGHPVYTGWDSVKLIGRSRKRHEELAHKRWDWRAFYNGWLEGRSDMLEQFRKDWDQMELIPSVPLSGDPETELGPVTIPDWYERWIDQEVLTLHPEHDPELYRVACRSSYRRLFAKLV